VLTKTLIIMSLMVTLTTVSLAQDLGMIIGWGSNVDFSDSQKYYGQAAPPVGNDFIAIDAGLYHSIAQKSDGSIAAWGIGSGLEGVSSGIEDHGQVTDKPDGNDFMAITAGIYHNVTIRSNGSLASWGSNASGQVSGTPTGNDFIAIAAGYGHSMALRSDGSLEVWGNNDYGQITNRPTDGNFIAIASSAYHCLAIAAEEGGKEGPIRAWGRDTYGQATPPEGHDFIAVAAGYNHSLALRSNGSLAAWGRDDGSPLGDFGQVTDTPGGNDFIAIACGYYHNIAIKSDGSIVAWGRDNKGQITGAPAGTNFIAVAAGGQHTLAIELNCLYQLQGDFDDNCRVDLSDFHILASAWISTYSLTNLQSITANWLTDCRLTPYYSACVAEQDCQYQLQGDFDDDCRVDLSDFYILASAWLSGYTVSDLQTMTDHWLTDCRLNPFDPACIPK
jgi:alpha-tubulin suppressor-like RCC1 family protein